jgi:hypothetical protein
LDTLFKLIYLLKFFADAGNIFANISVCLIITSSETQITNTTNKFAPDELTMLNVV